LKNCIKINIDNIVRHTLNISGDKFQFVRTILVTMIIKNKVNLNDNDINEFREKYKNILKGDENEAKIAFKYWCYLKEILKIIKFCSVMTLKLLEYDEKEEYEKKEVKFPEGLDIENFLEPRISKKKKEDEVEKKRNIFNLKEYLFIIDIMRRKCYKFMY